MRDLACFGIYSPYLSLGGNFLDTTQDVDIPTRESLESVLLWRAWYVRDKQLCLRGTHGTALGLLERVL